MRSIRTRFTMFTLCAIVIVVGVTMVIGIISIRKLGNDDAKQMLLLLCETGQKDLNSYLDSVEQSVSTVSTLVEEDLNSIKKDQFSEHIEHMRSVFEKAVLPANGVLTYYYRIDPEYSDSEKGFWYINTDGTHFKEHEVTDISLYDTEDTDNLVWFTVPKATGKPVWLPPYITDNLGARVISYNVPVYRHDRFVGVIGIEIDYSAMAREVDHITLYDHGYAFINDEEGNLIYHPVLDVVTMADEDIPETPSGLIRDKTVVRYNFDGQEKLGVWLPLHNGMRLNVSVPTAEINDRWQYVIWLLLGASAFLLVVVSIFNMQYTKRLTEPLRELTEATEKVNEGDYHIQLHYDGDDEVGILTRTFSNLVSNLNEKLYALAASEQANAAKTTFLSNMSHEIRTPITTILGMNEIICRESKDPAILGYCGNIRKAGNSLLGIISDILDFTKIEAGKMELVPAPYSLADLIGDLYNMVQFRAEEKGLALRLKIDPHLPAGLIGDELRIKQAVSNLMINAVKYTEAGSVTLTISLADADDETATLYMAVSDTGIGIRKEEIDRLFETFNRLDTLRNHTIEGVGLGLPICRQLLQMMGAEISITSAYNEGSIFSFYLKQEISDATEIGVLGEATVSQHTNPHVESFHFVSPHSRILLVDDTPMNLEVIKGLLKPTQMKVDVAYSGAECIEKFAVYPYDLVFLDYRMPKMNGIETLEKLKEEEPQRTEETPIISLTASAVQGERERMLDAGFTDFLTKPVNISQMEEMLVKYLPEDEVIFTEEEAQEQETDPCEGIPAEAFGYSWLDPKEGVEYCGSAEMYMVAIGLFVKSVDEKAALLEQCIENGDTGLYTITVHAIKSSSLSIGMETFSNQARVLELAGKDEDIEKIRRDTPDFIQTYLYYKKELERLLS